MSASETPKGTFSLVEGATLSLLASLASLTLIGYRFGDSNHGITVPILKRFIDPSLYPGDDLVATAERFPTIFYRTLAAVLPSTDAVPFAYFFLYVLSIALTYAAVYRMGVWASGDARVGALATLLAMPVRTGLAGESLYRVAFSHSHLASGLDLFAMALFLEGRRLAPILMLSLGVYNHALYSLYLLVPLTLTLLLEARTVPKRQTLIRLACAILPVLPFVAMAVSNGTPLTQEWVDLLKLRSAHHSFPSAFGDGLPDAVIWLFLGTIAATRTQVPTLRSLGIMVAATGLLFVLGTLFTEVWPMKAMLQFQPHRIWRFLSVLLLALMATDIALLWRRSSLSRIVAAFYFMSLFATGAEQLGPLVLIAVIALNDPKIPWWLRASAAVALATLSWPDRTIEWTEYVLEFVRRIQNPAVFATLAAAFLVLSIRHVTSPSLRRGLEITAFLAVLGPLARDNYNRQRIRFEQGSFREAQNWARENTPKNAVFLTPPKEAGFRVFSERTIVGEWKDGTQQYFDDVFAREWGRRMDLLVAKEWGQFSTDEIVDLAHRFGANYIVGQGKRRNLPVVFDGGSTVIYQVP